MIFSEVYSVYYNTVANIISSALDGERSEKEFAKIVTEKAFGESALTVLPALKNGRWQLMTPDFSPTLEHKPTMPLTTLQKQWLKAISLDPRIRLFGVELDGLDDVEPLFTSEDYVVYDKYGDGDPFLDEGYIDRFRFLLSAIRDRAQIKINMINRNGRSVYFRCIPVGLEYSEKDDKFRLITSGCRFMATVNLSKITASSRYTGEEKIGTRRREARIDTLTLKIIDERNALERVMLHFAHFEKRVEKLGKREYLVSIRYDHSDEQEMVIRVLSFGPLVRVVEPNSFIGLIKDKLTKQKSCNLR